MPSAGWSWSSTRSLACESGSPSVLVTMKKDVTPEKILVPPEEPVASGADDESDSLSE